MGWGVKGTGRGSCLGFHRERLLNLGKLICSLRFHFLLCKRRGWPRQVVKFFSPPSRTVRGVMTLKCVRAQAEDSSPQKLGEGPGPSALLLQEGAPAAAQTPWDSKGRNLKQNKKH